MNISSVQLPNFSHQKGKQICYVILLIHSQDQPLDYIKFVISLSSWQALT